MQSVFKVVATGRRLLGLLLVAAAAVGIVFAVGLRERSEAASGIWDELPPLVTPAAGYSYFNAQGWAVTGSSTVDPEIATFAETLGNNPDRIFNWVRNNVEVEWRFGMAKGGRGALIDKSGTSLDQANLLVEALRASGVPASQVEYVLGTATLTGAQFQAWTGITSPAGADHLLREGGIPATVTSSGGTITQVEMLHVWVRATIGGQVRLLDPSFKTNTLSVGEDVRAAMGFNGGTLVSAVGSGMTQEDTSGFTRLRNANVGSLNSTLNGYATALQSWLETNRPDKDIFEIVGGRRIVRAEVTMASQASPYAMTAQQTFNGGALPDALRTRMVITGPDSVATTHFVDAIYGRLVMFQHARGNGDYTSQLSIDGRSAGQPFLLSGQVHYVQLSINHPYATNAGTYMDEAASHRVGLYDDAVLVLGVGKGTAELGEHISQIYGKDRSYTTASNQPGGEPVTFSTSGRGLVAIGYGWLAQMDRMARITAAVAGATPEHHHTFGLASQVMPHDPLLLSRAQSMRLSLSSTVSVAGHAGPTATARAASHAIVAAGSALEGSLAEQVNDTPYPVSAVAKIAWSQSAANTDENNRWIYLATATNWTTTRPNFLANHPDYPGVRITAEVIDPVIAAGGFAVAPSSSFLGPSSTSAWRPDRITPGVPHQTALKGLEWGGAMIASSANRRSLSYAALRRQESDNLADQGGGGGAPPDPMQLINPSEAAAGDEKARSLVPQTGVDRRTGTLTVTPAADITAGQGVSALSFQREFRSGSSDGRFPVSRNADWMVRDGWSHNHYRVAALSSSGMNALGARAAREGAQAIVAAVASVHFYESGDVTPNATLLARWVGGALTHSWFTKSMFSNTVTVTTGHSSETFVRLASGAFAPAPGDVAVLTQTGTKTPRSVSWPAGWHTSSISFTLRRRDQTLETYAYVDARMSPEGEAGPIFSPVFHLTSSVAPQGVTLTYAYDTAGRLTSVANNLGVTLAFGYGAAPGDEITILHAASNRTARVKFDEPASPVLGQPATWTVRSWDPLNRETQYQMSERRSVFHGGALPATPEASYAAHLRLDRVTLPSGIQAARIGYDDYGRVRTVTDALDRITRYHAAGGGRYGRVVDALNNESVEVYDDESQLIASTDAMGRTSRKTYDGFGRLRTSTSPLGDVTTMSYDARGNLIQRTKTPRPTCAADYPAPADQAWWCQTITVTAEYHATWNKPTKVTLPATAADPTPREWTWAYNAQGLVQTQTGPALKNGTGGTSTPQWTTSYDAFGRVTSVQDPTGRENRTVWGTTGANFGCMLQSIVENGANDLITNYGCNAAGDVTTVTDPRTYVTTTTYDALRRKTVETGPAGTNIESRWTYDLDGNLTSEQQWDSTASLFRATTTTYSLTGQPLTVTDPSGDVARTCYDVLDRPYRTVDPMGRATTTEFNAAGQPTGIKRWYTASLTDATCALTAALPPNAPALPVGATPHLWRGMEYDAATGLQTAEIDANGNRTLMVYDGLGRQLKTIFADGSSSGQMLDQRGQVVTRHQRSGAFAEVFYDTAGRDRHVWERPGPVATTPATADPDTVSGPGRHSRANYDLAGRPVYRDVSTQTALVWDASLLREVRTYAYDAPGRVITDSVTSDGISGLYTLQYVYDAAGNRSQIRWQDGFVADYGFDAANRPSSITFAGQSANYTYDSLSRRAGLGRSNGTNTVYTYEPDSDLASLTQNFASSSGQPPTVFSLGHDPAGKITSIGINRLDFEWLPSMAYARTYGAANNMNQVPNETDATAAVALTYDANGNIATSTRTLTGGGAEVSTYTWAVGNRLIGYARPGVTASYGYDSDDRRTFRTVGGTMTRTVWSGADEVAQTTAAGALVRRFIPDGTGAMDGRLATVEANGTVHWHHTDHQGSVIATSNSAGQTVGVASYSPYGEFGGSQTAPPLGSPFGYTGREYDPETGLYQYRARYYSPRLGQFLSSDPIGTKDDPNLYLYVGADPVNATDPTGMCTASRIGAEGGSICGGTSLENLDSIPAADDSESEAPEEDAAAGGEAIQDQSGSAGAIRFPPNLPRASPNARTPQFYDGVPMRVRLVAGIVRSTGRPAPNTRGGGTFQNDGRGGGQRLPTTNGGPITYTEYDVNRYIPGVNRGPERLVVGSDGRMYYTSDHYRTFTEVRPPR